MNLLKRIKNKINIKLMLFSNLILFFSTQANATGFNLFNPLPQSKAMTVLNAMFGTLTGQGGGDPLAAGISVFLGAVLTVGGVLTAYTLLVGTLGTAHDGEMLGKAINSMFTPLRTGLGTACLLPAVKGYCLIQFVVIWVAMQGIGIADNVWSYAMSNQNIGQLVETSITRPDTTSFAYKVYQSGLCMATLNYAKTIPDASAAGFDKMNVGITTVKGLTSTTLQLGVTNGAGLMSTDKCGSVTVSNVSLPALPSTDSLYNIVQSLGNMDSVNANNQTLVTNVINQIFNYSTQDFNAIMNDKPLTGINNISTVANNYDDLLRQNAITILTGQQDNSELAKSASIDGFITAGSFYHKLVQINDLVTRTIANSPTATGPLGFDSDMLSDVWARVNVQVDKVMPSFNPGNINNYALNYTKDDSIWGSIKSIVKHFDINSALKSFLVPATNFVLQDGENMVMANQRLGNYVLETTSAAAIGLLGMDVTVGIHNGIASGIQYVLIAFISPALLVGVLLSYVIPMIPFFIWYGAVAGWCVAVIMAVIACPLWVVAHLNPHANTFVDGAKSGYLLLLSLLLRPVLMIFGLMASMVLITVIGNLIDYVFASSFAETQSDSNFIIYVLGTLIVQPILYGGLSIILMRKCFGLIHELPDEVLKWLGGGESFGHYSSGTGDSSNFVAVNQMGSGVGSAILDRANKRGIIKSREDLDKLRDKNRDTNSSSKFNADGLSGKMGKPMDSGSSGSYSSLQEKLNPNGKTDEVKGDKKDGGNHGLSLPK